MKDPIPEKSWFRDLSWFYTPSPAFFRMVIRHTVEQPCPCGTFVYRLWASERTIGRHR